MCTSEPCGIPAEHAIYFERASKNATNVWKTFQRPILMRLPIRQKEEKLTHAPPCLDALRHEPTTGPESAVLEGSFDKTPIYKLSLIHI